MNLANSYKCTGCGACYSVCPHHAIVMRPDKNGFLYPEIQKQKCVECGLCKDVCHVLKSPAPKSPKSCYVAETQNRELHIASSSGGIFGELALSILRQGGYVAGCGWDKKMQARHTVVNNKKELTELFCSKYVQSDIGDTLIDVKKLISADKRVLFSGTPCQIAGLKRYLGKEYDNLLTVEVICHGVPSPGVFEKYKKSQEINNKERLIDINFRSKERIYETDYISLTFENKKTKSMKSDDLFFKSFIRNLILRESCFNCCSKDGKSGADITLGDFWGIQKIFPEYHKNGHSAVIIRSEKGMRFWNAIKQNVTFREVSYENICKGNSTCRQSVSKSLAYNFYMSSYKVLGLKWSFQSSLFLSKAKRVFFK